MTTLGESVDALVKASKLATAERVAEGLRIPVSVAAIAMSGTWPDLRTRPIEEFQTQPFAIDGKDANGVSSAVVAYVERKMRLYKESVTVEWETRFGQLKSDLSYQIARLEARLEKMEPPLAAEPEEPEP